MKRIPSLDGLRAISIVFVVLGHMAHRGNVPGLFWESYAYLGVRIFYVIFARMFIFPSYQTRFCGILFAAAGMAAVELLTTIRRHPAAIPYLKPRASAA